MFTDTISLINQAKKIVVIQAENPDGDSMGSALALEEILSDAGKDVVLYCAIDIPKYMHYIRGWDRVTKDWPSDRDVAIIVDTASELLIERALATPGVRHYLESHPVLVIDHHEADTTLPFETINLFVSSAVATGEIIYTLAQEAGWPINAQGAENLFLSIQADSLGLTTQGTTADSYRVAAELVALGAVPHDIESRRREYMKKPADILAYKGELIGRIEYFLDSKLALVHIPWEDIQQYSDRYNPSVLVLDEMRLVEGVVLAVAVKTYPDGKATGKIRSNLPIAHQVAGFFGGGGHEYAAGFKLFEDYETLIPELVSAVEKAVSSHES
ncbi:hypothetical protein GW930_00900 [Candidatus Saccharibacteria bacterium]|nr:hypothetical protein [Candidatus Saccharibacteria bacterium]